MQQQPVSYAAPATTMNMAAPAATHAAVAAYPAMKMGAPATTYGAQMTSMSPSTVSYSMGSSAMSYGSASTMATTYAAGPAVFMGGQTTSLMAPAIVNSAFNALDRNHDGMITRSEFDAVMRG